MCVMSSVKGFISGVFLCDFRAMLTWCFVLIVGEFHRRRDQVDDGQEAEYPQHVRHRSC